MKHSLPRNHCPQNVSLLDPDKKIRSASFFELSHVFSKFYLQLKWKYISPTNLKGFVYLFFWMLAIFRSCFLCHSEATCQSSCTFSERFKFVLLKRRTERKNLNEERTLTFRKWRIRKLWKIRPTPTTDIFCIFFF